MTRLALAVSLLTFVGCKPTTGVTDDTGTDDTGLEDTAPVEIPCERFEVAGELVVPATAAVPTGSVTMELAFVDFASGALDSSGGRALDDLGPIGAGQDVAFSLCIDAVPPSSDLYVIDAVNSPDFRVASYALRAFEDDGSGGVASWVGASVPTFLFWAEGTLPQDWVDSGLVAGWNRVTIDLVGDGGSASAFLETSTIDVDAQLLYTEPTSLGGTIAPNLSAEASLVAGLWNINRFVDANIPPPVQATVGGTAVTVTGSAASFALGTLGQPPADHLATITDFDYVMAAFYMGAVWTDANGSSTFEVGETMHANTTSATPSRTVLYLAATDWRAAIYSEYGMKMGWNLFEANAPIPWTDGVLLDAP